jgi:GntR family transcriptional regulator
MIPAKTVSSTPAYKRIQRVIQERIDAGHLTPGDAVPSERELARTHQVSLMTARHALAGLEREGLVERRRGAGTFVAPPKIHFNKLVSFTEEMTSRGLAPYSRVLGASIVNGDHEVAARLGLDNGGQLVKVERLRLAAKEPFALESCYMPAQEFGGLVETGLERRSLFTILKQEYGIELAYADEEVGATAADARTAELLAVPRGSPLLRIRQVIFSTAAKPTIYVLGYYRSDRHTLLVRRFRQ